MEEKKARLDAIVEQLNRRDKENPYWTPIDDTYAFMEVDLSSKNGVRSARFKPNSGVPVKLFMNTKTGEVKTFIHEATTR